MTMASFRSGCRLAQAIGRCALAVMALGLGASQASADRHCYVGLDGYFAARQPLLSEGAACAPAMERALELLDSAAGAATTCGCAELVERFRALRATAADKALACADRRALVLDARDEIEALVLDCNF